ncbi:MAG TPA: hypothetical protein VGU63_07335 [Candidatus Acidoferrales bacterium]|nr:hypothetical protein [Candidatus Acidoferrales bacterium]
MQAWPVQHPASFVIVTLAVFWIVVSLFVSYGGGWHVLARRFRFNSEFTGKVFRWQSAHMRSVARYHNCVSIGANLEGLYVAPFFPFRIAHPPLFIPWSEVSYTRKKIFFSQMFCFELGREHAIPFWVGKNLGEQLQQAAGIAWPAESLG